MTLKKRSIKCACAADGSFTGTLGLGAAYGMVKAIRWDSGADSSSDLTISSSLPAYDSGNAAKTHAIFTRTGVDASAAGGVVMYVVPVEGETYDSAGEVAAANNGEAGDGLVAHSPLTLTIANGGTSETHYVDVFVEV